MLYNTKVEILKQVQDDNKKRGFTLIELLVVVLIIGILAAVALPQYQKAVMKTRYAKLKLLVKSISDAEEVYYLENGNYTGEISSLDIDWPETPNRVAGINTAKNAEYYFDWGYCSINVPDDDTKRIVCVDNSSEMRYRRVLQRDSTQLAGMQGCSALQSNKVGTQICQQESGSTTARDGYNTNNSRLDTYYW